MVRRPGEKAEGKRKKAEVIVFCSIDEYPSQLDAGEKVFLARQPNFFILPFASHFCLQRRRFLTADTPIRRPADTFPTPTRRYVSALRPLAHLIATFRGQETSSKVATFSVGCTVETYDYATRSN
jgi:hypothetical protein